ncbi:hypothetical protein V3C99_005566 [Haemonchus contortus]
MFGSHVQLVAYDLDRYLEQVRESILQTIMTGRKRNGVRSPQMEKDEDYEEKRRRNNEAVNRTREKKRQEETETAKKVEELRVENEKLERQVESLQKELSFLKEMFVAYANGSKKPGDTPSSSSS